MADHAKRVLTLTDLFQISEWQQTLAWAPFRDGIDIHGLYGDGTSGPATALLRFHPGARVPLHEHTGYEHILVLAGSQVDENSRAAAGTLIVNPPQTRHSVMSETGCIVLAIYEKPVAFLEPQSLQPQSATPCMKDQSRVHLAVNGTLMRGLALNPNLVAVSATFVRESATAATYRLWSIEDRHPAMIRVAHGGASIAVEIWSVPVEGLATILMSEPAGLCIGKVMLADGSEVLGVLGEPLICEGQKEITGTGGWRAYIATSSARST